MQIGAVLGVAVLGAGLAQFLRQPLIVAFIAVGIVLGPSALGVIEEQSEIDLFARLGIALLLFVVGLKLDLHIIRTVGPVALSSGLAGLAGALMGFSRGQVSAEAFALFVGIGFLTAAYVGGITTLTGALIAGVSAPLGLTLPTMGA